MELFFITTGLSISCHAATLLIVIAPEGVDRQEIAKLDWSVCYKRDERPESLNMRHVKCETRIIPESE